METTSGKHKVARTIGRLPFLGQRRHDMPEALRRQMRFITPGGGECGLGDLLVMLRYRQFKNDIVITLPTKASHLAPLFYGVAPVFVTDNPAGIPKARPGAIPTLELTAAEILDGEAWASEFYNPVILKVNCAKRWTHIRETDHLKWQALVDSMPGRQFIQLGIQSHFRPLNGTVKLLGLDVRKMAALMKAIGIYVGVDTGEMHMAMAVGCKCFVARPSDCVDYPYSMWQYNEPNMNYFGFDEIEKIAALL